MTLTDGLLMAMAAMLLVQTGLLIWMTGRVSRAAGKLEETLADLRRTNGRIGRIAETVEEGAALACRALEPAWVRFAAIAGGVKKTFDLLLDAGPSHRSVNGAGRLGRDEK